MQRRADGFFFHRLITGDFVIIAKNIRGKLIFFDELSQREVDLSDVLLLANRAVGYRGIDYPKLSNFENEVKASEPEDHETDKTDHAGSNCGDSVGSVLSSARVSSNDANSLSYEFLYRCFVAILSYGVEVKSNKINHSKKEE